MIRIGIALLISLAAFGQGTTITKSRSNVKDNLIARVEPTPDGKLRCVLDDGKPCTAQHAVQLKTYDLKSQIKALSISGTDGTLTCDGKPCTAAHLGELNKALTSMKAITKGGTQDFKTAEKPK